MNVLPVPVSYVLKMAYQIHVSGFDSEAESRDDDGIEMLIALSGLSEEDGWCGPGTTIVKRGQNGQKCYAFVSFYHLEAAAAAIDMINGIEGGYLRAEAPKVRGGRPASKAGEDDMPDLHFRRKRLPSTKKHPDGLKKGSTQDANYRK